MRLYDKMGGSITYDELKYLLARCSPYLIHPIRNFIETGTYKGDTTIVAASVFAHVYTMEINRALYEQVQEKLVPFPNIHSYHGDSVKILPEIMKQSTGDCMWFLDAHQSGSDTGNNGTNVPLYDEFEAIFGLEVNHSPRRGIVIVDDVRLFDRYWDWKGISTASIQERLGRYGIQILKQFIHNDRYILVIA